MSNSTDQLITVESFNLRITPDEYEDFPFVDNKGFFPNFYKSQDLETEILKVELEENFTYAIYKKFGWFYVLICAFSNAAEINTAAMEIIKRSPGFKLSLNNILRDKNEH